MSRTRLSIVKEYLDDSEHLALTLVGRRRWLRGYLNLETGAFILQSSLDTDYIDAVLEAVGTSVVKLIRQHLADHLHEPDIQQIFPDFPCAQVRTIGGRLFPAGYRLFFESRRDGEMAVGYYALFTKSAAGLFPSDSNPSVRVKFGAGVSITEAEYLALIAGLAELVSQVLKQETQPPPDRLRYLERQPDIGRADES